MIKEAQDSPGKNPVVAESNAAPENTAPMPMSGSGAPTPDVRPFGTSAPAVPAQETLTADQLAGKWIEDKEKFYRSKATKYPQYNNWTMSNQNRNKMIEQAQNMLNTPGGREKAWASYNAPRYGTTSAPYRDEAFEHASIANTAEIEKANAPAREARRQAEEAQRAQQAPMQNPVAPAAIGDPVPATVPLSTASSYEAPDPRDAAYAAPPAKDLSSAVNAMQDFFTKNGYNPNPLSPGYKAFVKYMGNVLRELYPNMPQDQAVYAFMDYLRESGSDEAKSVLPFMDSAVVHHSWPGGIPQRLGRQFPVYPSARGAYYMQPVNK